MYELSSNQMGRRLHQWICIWTAILSVNVIMSANFVETDMTVLYADLKLDLAPIRYSSVHVIDYNFSSDVLFQYKRSRPYDLPYYQILTRDMYLYELGYENNDSMSINLPLVSPAIPENIIIQNPTSSLFINKLWGVALDGVPIYSSLFENGIDGSHEIDINVFPYKVDQCGGTYGPVSADSTDIIYHYRYMPTCILNNNFDHREMNIQRRQQYISDPYELLDFFGEDYGPKILGYSLEGVPIYSPYNDRGILQNGLDNCNGKYVNGSYGYYVTPTFPYIIGCNGPGVYNYVEDTITDESHPTNKNTNKIKFKPCPGGYYPTIEGNGCTACPAGTYSSVPYGLTGVSDISVTQDSAILACVSVCPIGTYCPKGSVQPVDCPGGRYGSNTGAIDIDCTGPCSEGYFCPLRSTSPTQHPCGNETHYCPIGSSHRNIVDKSFYSIPEEANTDNRVAQLPCPPGTYCTNGKKNSCPSGTYGHTSNLMNSNCTDLCPLGHYCSENSVNPVQCPPGTYGGSYGLQNSSCSGLCLKGYYCEIGSISSTESTCVGGRYGDHEGLTSSQCSTECEIKLDGTQFCIIQYCSEGYYCPPGSISGQQNECGGSNYYCPIGVAYPYNVSTGYYSIGLLSSPSSSQNYSDSNVRTAQYECEPGYYCTYGVRTPCQSGYYSDVLGANSSYCKGPCTAGYYCESASPSPTQHLCGNSSQYCPIGSSTPTLVPLGYYSVNGTISTKSAIQICPPGSYCIGGVRRPCTAGYVAVGYGSSSAQCDGVCSAGYYCPLGSAFMIPCPSGTYGLVSTISSDCTGPCSPGYYCPLGSTSPTQMECGGQYMYCPLNSSLPMNVSLNHYTVGGTATTRTGQVVCVSTRVSPCPSTTRKV